MFIIIWSFALAFAGIAAAIIVKLTGGLFGLV